MHLHLPFHPNPLPKLKASPLLLPKPPRRETAVFSTATMYEVLEVPPTAGLEEIKTAYSRQERRWHPDACPPTGDKPLFAQQFMRAREAYEVLSEPESRKRYDAALLATGEREDWEGQLEALRRWADRAERTTWPARMRML